MRLPNESLLPWEDERTPALAIVARGDQIRRLTPTHFEVRSQSRPGRKYSVWVRKDRWGCSCRYNQAARRTCIHILAIRYQVGLSDRTGDDSLPRECEECGSPRVIRFGKRYNHQGAVRRYLCKGCGHRFTLPGAGRRLRHDAQHVALALDLYFRGLSLRKVADHLRQAHGARVSATAIHGWIGRFVPSAARWMNSLGARTGEQWHIDETVVRSSGHPLWVWNVEDASTRFLLATHVTRARRQRDARVVLRRAKTASPDRPLAVLTDGLAAYRRAVGRELAFRSGAEVVNPHLRVPSIRAKRSNNLVERLHGTEKERIKVMRGFHSRQGVARFMEGFRVHYNLIRPHAAIGATPAAAAGLPSPSGFGWKSVLESAAKRIPPGQAELVFVATPGRTKRKNPSSPPDPPMVAGGPGIDQ